MRQNTTKYIVVKWKESMIFKMFQKRAENCVVQLDPSHQLWSTSLFLLKTKYDVPIGFWYINTVILSASFLFQKPLFHWVKIREVYD